MDRVIFPNLLLKIVISVVRFRVWISIKTLVKVFGGVVFSLDFLAIELFYAVAFVVLLVFLEAALISIARPITFSA